MKKKRVKGFMNSTKIAEQEHAYKLALLDYRRNPSLYCGVCFDLKGRLLLQKKCKKHKTH